MKASAEKSSSTVSRTTASRPFFAKTGSGSFFAPVNRAAVPAVQAKMTVGKTGDKFEREADKMADKVMRMPSPASSAKEEKIQRKADEKLQKKENEKLQKAPAEEKIQKKEDDTIRKAPAREDKLQRKGNDAAPSVSPTVQSAIRSKTSGGQPLSADVRRDMESRFNADFSKVRIHSNAEAAGLSNQLSARAFTHQNHIFFSRNQYQPGSSEGRQLLAHELTHTIQQGRAVQRSPQVSTTVTPPVVQRWSWPKLEWPDIPNPIEYLVNKAKETISEKAESIYGFPMLTVIIGRNPITGEAVDRSPSKILKAAIDLIPSGESINQALENHKVFDKVSVFAAKQFDALKNIGSNIWQDIKNFLTSFSKEDLLNLGKAFDTAKGVINARIEQIKSFAIGLKNDIVGLVKDLILKPLAAFIKENSPNGYDLLCAVLGKDPISGEPVPQTAENLIGPFMKLIGEEEVWNKMQQAKAIPRAWAWFQKSMTTVKGYVTQIPGLALTAFKSLVITDIVMLPNAFNKIKSVFGGFVVKFVTWAGNAVWNLLEIIFDVFSPGVLEYIKKTGSAIKDILKNPIPFVGNLVKAAKQGFLNFSDKIGTHLKEGLIDWLVGSLQGAGVYIPKALNLAEMGKFALSVLGITWTGIRKKIVKALGDKGETIVGGIEKGLEWAAKGFEIVKKLMDGGIDAAWEMIKEKLTDMKDTVVEGIKEFVVDTIVTKAVPKLVGMFIPGAGFLLAIKSIYDTIMVFQEQLSKIIQVVTAFLDSIVNIAAGNITAAATRVEKILGGLLSLALNFLAGFLNLNKISEKIKNVIDKIRDKVDKAIDKAIEWIVTKAKELFGKIKEMAGKMLEWWKEIKKFNKGKENHKLFFVGKEKSAKLNVESTRMTLRSYLDTQVKPKISNNDKKFSKIILIEKSIEKIEKLKTETSYGQQAGKDINLELDNIATLLNDLSDDVPKTANINHITHTLPDGSTVGKEVTVVPLTRKPPDNSAGSAPYQTNPTWLAVNQRTNAYVRGHLLNHHLYGPGKNENLTPISRSMNTGIMSNKLEEPSKEAVFGKGKILRYNVKMHYEKHKDKTRKIPQELCLPTKVEMKSEQVEADGNNWKQIRVIFLGTQEHELPPDSSPIGAKLKLHRLAINAPYAGDGNPSAEEALLHLKQIGEERVKLLLNEKFKSWDELEKKVNHKGIVDLWKSQKSEADNSRLVYFSGKTEWKVAGE